MVNGISFFTYHEKSLCNGVNGTLKRLVGKASLQSLNQHIDTPKKVFD